MKVSIVNIIFCFNNCSWTWELYGNTPLLLLGVFKLSIQSGSGTSRSLIPAADWIKRPPPLHPNCSHIKKVCVVFPFSVRCSPLPPCCSVALPHSALSWNLSEAENLASLAQLVDTSVALPNELVVCSNINTSAAIPCTTDWLLFAVCSIVLLLRSSL